MTFTAFALSIIASLLPGGPRGLPMHRVEPSPMIHRPVSFQTVSELEGVRGNRVLLVVADYAADPLSSQLATLQSDIASQGWDVELQVMSGGTAEDLKSLLQNTLDLDGAILIGFLPCAWYEDTEEEFPCELFMMDLDGTWTDGDGDGLYDGHSGDVAPEIWLGRIDAHAAPGPEIPLLAAYLEKNHLYRTGSMGLDQSALAFNDDDWNYYSDCGLDDIYGPSNVTVVNSSAQTTAADYLLFLDQGYEFVHLMAHSCPWGHTFKVPGGMAGTVMAPEISEVNPRTAFYQLFSCSNARWVEQGCLGNWYLFGTDYGLLITGAAKTGSMLDFEEYYGPLASGSSFGEAFRDWWEYQAQGGFSADERAWFYGNALLGDPTLRPMVGSGATAADRLAAEISAAAQQVSTSSYSDCHPDAATGSGAPGQSVAAWVSGENGRLDVAARLYEEGAGWGSVIYVDPDEYWDMGVSACYHDTSPWIAWSDFEYATYSYRIKTACSVDFSQVEVQVEQEGYQVFPELASDGDRLWLAWLDWDAEGGAVMLKSLDGEFTDTQLSGIGEWCQNPGILAGNGGTMHLIWERRTPSGSSVMWCCGDTGGFSSPVEVSSGELCHSPALGYSSQDSAAVLVWSNETSAGTSLMKREWESSSWSDEMEVYSSNENISHISYGPLPEPAGEGLMWQEDFGGSARVMALPASGGTAEQLLSFTGPQWCPVSTAGQVFWAGNQGTGWDIFAQEFTELGVEGEDPSIPGLAPVLCQNPVRSSLRFYLPSGSRPVSTTLTVYDLSGRSVKRTGVDIQPEGFASVDCSGLPAGVYTAVFRNGAEPVRFVLVK